jgi:hypothetical protein
VLAWSCDAIRNPVQAEYILEEKVPGVRLGAAWYNLPWASKIAIIDQVAEYDASLSAVRFERHGCVYFKQDLKRLAGHSEAIRLSSGQQTSTLEQYTIEPLIKAELWDSAREQLGTDRGPCKCIPIDHFPALAYQSQGIAHKHTRERWAPMK